MSCDIFYFRQRPRVRKKNSMYKADHQTAVPWHTGAGERYRRNVTMVRPKHRPMSTVQMTASSTQGLDCRAAPLDPCNAAR